MQRYRPFLALLAILAPVALGAQEGQHTFLRGLCSGSDSAVGPGSYVEHPERPPVLKAGTRFPPAPREVHRAGYDGNVVVAFVVETNGRVRAGSVAVLQSTDPVLSRWACDAVPTLSFAPGRDHGTAVASQAVMPFSWHGPPAGAPASPTAADTSERSPSMAPPDSLPVVVDRPTLSHSK